MKHRNPALAPGFLLPGKTFVRTCPALPAKEGPMGNEPQTLTEMPLWVLIRRLGVCELPEEQSGDRGPH